MTVILVLVVSIVILVLVSRGIVAYSELLLRLLVERKHRDTEMITETDLAPPDWPRRISFRVLGFIGGKPAKKRMAMQRINRLISYFQRTPLVDDEDTRRLIVSQLTNARKLWKQRNWDEIYPYK